MAQKEESPIEREVRRTMGRTYDKRHGKPRVGAEELAKRRLKKGLRWLGGIK